MCVSRLHNLCRDEFLANLHVDNMLFLGKRCLHISHTYTHFCSRQHDTAGDITNRIALCIAKRIATTWNSTLLTLKMHQFAFYAFGFLLEQVLFVDKVLSIKLRNPTQSCLQWRGGVINIMT